VAPPGATRAVAVLLFVGMWTRLIDGTIFQLSGDRKKAGAVAACRPSRDHKKATSSR
jgi:hypothetical protein